MIKLEDLKSMSMIELEKLSTRITYVIRQRERNNKLKHRREVHKKLHSIFKELGFEYTSTDKNKTFKNVNSKTDNIELIKNELFIVIDFRLHDNLMIIGAKRFFRNMTASCLHIYYQEFNFDTFKDDFIKYLISYKDVLERINKHEKTMVEISKKRIQQSEDEIKAIEKLLE